MAMVATFHDVAAIAHSGKADGAIPEGKRQRAVLIEDQERQLHQVPAAADHICVSVTVIQLRAG
jgi:hypothetical protein